MIRNGLAAKIVIMSDAAAVRPNESTTCKVNVEVPLVRGVPEIAPVLLMVKPFGKLPVPVNRNVYGAVPPVAEMFAL